MRKASSGLFRRLGLWLVAPLLLMVLVSAASARDLDLSKAVKVGNGKIMVIEFTDPDCPFCRKAEAYFQKRSDVTRYIFFIPLKSHPASKGKVQYILSAKDKEKAYLEVAAGTADRWKLSEVTPEGVALQQEHEQIAKEHGMNATPIFMVYGSVVRGFDLNKLVPLLK
ncbi:thioredoxin fold domain-containing protein [Geomonas sp. Red69]|uniref:Thioredoxin fold domain-containing protein n=1 Tax=Geomonas diazotrophica TaxID=2843197 RepID=A0ABX8JNS6_9BACT|nr:MULTISPECIES: thioredoxin fold domain-containing protein [Geomonas]MBU5638701.1 thioredoxin fold domain-containing protein [Geomonas diazotrophica]QWV98262.1 thioredoxin fold domain-containing protein [Geomonas nitrogeniifigens]QXE87446.1 thioredoxin fold domain-containing protein [Geomonas nitrogeniifigens]